MGVLLVMSDITDGKDVLLALDPEVLVDGDTLVILELETAGLQELGGRGDTDSEDEQIGRDVVGVLERDGADLLGVGF